MTTSRRTSSTPIARAAIALAAVDSSVLERAGLAHDRRKGTKWLSLLDHAVELLTHRAVLCGGQDRTLTERTRAPLIAPCGEGDDLLLRKKTRDLA